MIPNLYLKIYQDIIPGYYILGYPKISYEIKLQCVCRSVPPLLAPPRAIHPRLVLLHDPPAPPPCLVPSRSFLGAYNQCHATILHSVLHPA